MKYFPVKGFLLLVGLVTAAAGVLHAGDTVAALKKENRELREKLLKTSDELRRLKLWVGDVASGDAGIDREERQQILLRKLEELSGSGRKLALQVDKVSSELRRTVAALPLGPARKAQLSLRLDELELMSRRYLALLSKKQRQYESHVIAIDRKLGVVVLSGGAGQGMFPGMVFRNVSGSGDLRLRVIGVRPSVCAAEIISGSWEQLMPGMALSALTEKHQ